MPIRLFGMPAFLVPRLAPRLAAAVAAVAALAVSASPAYAGVVSRQLPQSPAQIRAYWTPQRMEAADPVDLPPASGSTVASGGSEQANAQPSQIHPTTGTAAFDFEPGSETNFPQRVHGKVFFTIPNVGDAACSGTVVASRLKNVVFTAGHCVHYPGSEPSTNFVFVPGYRDGAEPLGEYPATTLLAPDEWNTDADPSFDVAIAEISAPLELTLGGRGIAFNKPPRTAYQIFGYPGLPNPPYDGGRLIECDAPFFGLEEGISHPFSTVVFPCTMREGSSGGGWINPAGDLVSVVSHGYLDPSLDGQMAGPYFGQAVKQLYNQAGGSAECPPAKQAVVKARKQLKKANKADRRKSSRKTGKKLKKAKRRFAKKKNARDAVC